MNVILFAMILGIIVWGLSETELPKIKLDWGILLGCLIALACFWAMYVVMPN